MNRVEAVQIPVSGVQWNMKFGAPQPGAARLRICTALAALPLAGGWLSLSAAQVQPPQLTPQTAQVALADAVRYQLHDMESQSYSLEYCVREQNEQGQRLRERVETKDGPVYRMFERDGHPLSQEEDDAERSRLRSLTASDIAKKRRSEESNRKFSEELIAAMPNAYLATPTPGQPQLPGIPTPQIVLELHPNPNFHAASSSQAMLPGLSGRAWVSASDHHLVRIEAHVEKNLNLAWGLVARVYSGGSLTFQQRPVGEGHMLYSDISADVTLRELMVHTRPYRLHLTSCGARLLPQAPTLAQGVQMLLNMDAPTSGQQLARVSGTSPTQLASGPSAHAATTNAHACCGAR